MTHPDALARLPAAHATALRLHEAGQPDHVIALALGIEVEGVAPLLAVAAAKREHLAVASSPDANGHAPGRVETPVGDTVEDVVALLSSAGPFMRVPHRDLVALVRASRDVTLSAGDTLIHQDDPSDELYVLLDGTLRATLRDDEGVRHDLGTMTRGAVVGEVALLAGGRRASTVVADAPARLIGLPAPVFDRLLEDRPALGAVLAEGATRRLRMAQLVGHLTSLFPTMDPAGLAEIEQSVEWVTLEAGEPLFLAGDEGDAAYLVVAGRLRVAAADADGEEQVVAEIGRGELVGEMALLDDAPRNATVFAARDTDLARLPRAEFLALIERFPRAMVFVARTVLDRVRTPAVASRRSAPTGVSIAVVAAHASVPVEALASRLASELARLGRVRHLSSDTVDGALGRPGTAQSRSGDPGAVRLGQWLHAVEDDHDLLLYEADRDWSPWTRRCVRQADQVVVVADATADPGRTEIEEQLQALLGGRRQPHERLLLVHPPDTVHPTGTPRWLDHRGVEDVHHVRWDREADVARVARLLAGRGVGLVLSGGGARGFAHVGVVQALREAGVPIDMVAGASMGMALGTMIAMAHADHGDLVTLATDAFASIRDYTFPAVSVLKGERIAAASARVHEGRDLSDLWLPFLGISTNLTTSRVAVHRRGDISSALRASVAIPGVIPPVVYGDDIHVDGGVLNNLPVDEMRRRMPSGTIVAVDVAPRGGPRAHGEVGLAVSGWRVMADRLRGRRPALPGLTNLMLRATLAGSNQARDRAVQDELADLYLQLELPRCGLLEFEAADRIIAAGHEAAVEPVTRWLAAGPPPWRGAPAPAAPTPRPVPVLSR